jgi:hypothetical protein
MKIFEFILGPIIVSVVVALISNLFIDRTLERFKVDLQKEMAQHQSLHDSNIKMVYKIEEMYYVLDQMAEKYGGAEKINEDPTILSDEDEKIWNERVTELRQLLSVFYVLMPDEVYQNFFDTFPGNEQKSSFSYLRNTLLINMRRMSYPESVFLKPEYIKHIERL